MVDLFSIKLQFSHLS